MKKIILSLFLSIAVFFNGFFATSNVAYSQAITDKNSIIDKSLSSSSDENILGIDSKKLREGDVDVNTIPIVLANIANNIIILAGIISIFMLIFFAFRMQINSGITGDSSGVDKSRKGMIASAVGFVIAVSAWFVMARLIDVLTMVSNK